MSAFPQQVTTLVTVAANGKIQPVIVESPEKYTGYIGPVPSGVETTRSVGFASRNIRNFID